MHLIIPTISIRQTVRRANVDDVKHARSVLIVQTFPKLHVEFMLKRSVKHWAFIGNQNDFQAKSCRSKCRECVQPFQNQIDLRSIFGMHHKRKFIVNLMFTTSFKLEIKIRFYSEYT